MLERQLGVTQEGKGQIPLAAEAREAAAQWPTVMNDIRGPTRSGMPVRLGAAG